MRHYNPTSTSMFSSHRYRPVETPYCSQYIDSYYRTGFANAKPFHTYVKILQYIADHDGCSRAEVHHALGYYKTLEVAKSRASRGFLSTLWSQLNYIDVIDYDSKFRYHITDAGREVLKKAYANANVKYVLGK